MMDADKSHGRGKGGRGRRRLLRVVAALLLLAGFGALVVLLLDWRQPRRTAAARRPGAPVSGGQGSGCDAARAIVGHGTVTPKVVMDITPEVAGRVTYVHSGLKAGGVIPAGEKILQIDPADYELAVRQARALVAEAQARLDAEAAETAVMSRDWHQVNPERPADSLPILWERRVGHARAALESARARLAGAELQLPRTAVSLPFDVLVVEARVGLGQYVPGGQPVAKAYGIDAFEVEIPLRAEDLVYFDDPAALLPTGAAARRAVHLGTEVRTTFAGREYSWPGYVVGTAGRVDVASQRLPLVVEIPRPLEAGGDRPPLLPGTRVEVLLAGSAAQDADVVPADTRTSEDTRTLQRSERR
jgi:multidrug efflux pump subunit AcrA (membrane-fusion protein)